jgi:hypothetical protein
MYARQRTPETIKINDATVISDIRAAMNEYHRYTKTNNDDASRRTTWQCRAAYRKHFELIEAAIARFGELNGWRRTDNGFRLTDIGKQSGDFPNTNTALFDHCIWFRGDRRCAAIVAQPYGHASYAEALAIAARHGVACHAPPFSLLSLHFPGATKFFVFTRPEHRIIWLPEQVKGWSKPKVLGGVHGNGF